MTIHIGALGFPATTCSSWAVVKQDEVQRKTMENCSLFSQPIAYAMIAYAIAHATIALHPAGVKCCVVWVQHCAANLNRSQLWWRCNNLTLKDFFFMCKVQCVSHCYSIAIVSDAEPMLVLAPRQLVHPVHPASLAQWIRHWSSGMLETFARVLCEPGNRSPSRASVGRVGW